MLLIRGFSPLPFPGARAKNDFTDTDQSTGLEKKEYDALVAGIEVCELLLYFLFLVHTYSSGFKTSQQVPELLDYTSTVCLVIAISS